MNEPEFLTVEDVALLHEEQLARYGGGVGIRDPGGLDSAVAQAQAGVLGALCDLFENASFITYAWGSMRGADFIEPALPLAYYVTNFKESLLGIGIVMFGTIFPRRTALEWTLSILMILGAPLDALAIAYPNLKQLPTLLFVLALPLMSIYFFNRFRNAE